VLPQVAIAFRVVGFGIVILAPVGPVGPCIPTKPDGPVASLALVGPMTP
jgi:hypothetical protein